MMLSSYMIVVSSALLAALVCWWEYRRANTARRWLRCGMILVAAGNLVLFAYPSEKASTDSITGILLTTGYDRDSLYAMQKLFPSAPAYSPETYIASGDTSIHSWHVLGYGLDRVQLQSLNAAQLFFHPSPLQTGIISSNWKKELSADEPFVIQGTCTNKENKKLQIILEGYGVLQDSVSIPADTTTGFALRSATRHNGQAVFRLQLKQGGKLLENNAVPFTTVPSKKTRLLVLSSAPDFEYRFLQNWLGKAGYPSAIRTTTSRDKTEQAFINRASLPLHTITTSLLDSFDVVVGDLAAIDALGENERAAIRQQVAGKGLGLLLRGDTIGATRFYTQGVALQTIKANAQQTISPKLINEKNALAVLPASAPVVVRRNAQLTDWVTDAAGNTLVAASLHGMGKIAISTLDNTYQWILSGQEMAYGNYWTSLLRSVARQENNNISLVRTNQIYTKEQPIPVNLVNADTLLPVVAVNDKIHLPLHQRSIPFLWQGTFWPLEPGWQTISAGSDTQYLYVYDQDDWPMVKAAERLAATIAWAQQGTPGVSPIASQMRWEKWWSVVLFLLALGFLWVERKYFT